MVGVGSLRSRCTHNSTKASASPTSAPARELRAPRSHRLRSAWCRSAPASGTTGVPSDATVSVQFSVPLEGRLPDPDAHAGRGRSLAVVTPNTFAFVASAPFVPSTTETVTVPAGGGGVASATGKTLAQSVDGLVHRGRREHAPPAAAPGPAGLPAGQLHSGPSADRPSGGGPGPGGTRSTGAGPSPPPWSSLWTVGTTNQITKGAVMAFESQHDMKTDGLAGPAVWQQLLADAAAGDRRPDPYNYVYVSKSLPETATVYSNGAAVYSTRANTGVAGAPTATAPSRSTALQGHHHVRAPTPTAPSTWTRASRGSATSTGAMPCTVSSGAATASPERRLRGDAAGQRRGGLPPDPDRHPGHRAA